MIPRIEMTYESTNDDYAANKAEFRAVSPVQLTLKRSGEADIVLGRDELYEILRVMVNRGLLRFRADLYQAKNPLYRIDYQSHLCQVLMLEVTPDRLYLLDNEDGDLECGYEWEDTDCLCVVGSQTEVICSNHLEPEFKATTIRKPKKKGGK